MLHTKLAPCCGGGPDHRGTRPGRLPGGGRRSVHPAGPGTAARAGGAAEPQPGGAAGGEQPRIGPVAAAGGGLAVVGNATTPDGSLALAQAVTKFVQDGGAANLMGNAPSAAVTQQAAGPVHGANPLMTPGTATGPFRSSSTSRLPARCPAPRRTCPPASTPSTPPARVADAMPEVPTRVPSPAEAAVTPAAAALPAPGPGTAPAPAAAPSFDPEQPAQAGLHVPVDRQRLPQGRRQRDRDRDRGGRARQDPRPGPTAGQTAYVFTAVGTPAPAAEQKLPLNVTWVNLTNGRSGSATLKPNPGINPQGPTTLTAIVDTGSGSIMSTIFGQVTTLDNQCTFMPTIGSTVVP